MSDPTPPDSSKKDDPAAAGPEIPALWRVDEPLELPGETATPRRRVFLWLLGFLAVTALSVSVMIWLRPAPQPYFAPFWLSDYQYLPFQTPPYSRQDQAALLEGKYFAQGHIQLKAIGTCSPADTLVVYIAGHAVCNAQGAVQILPIDADPTMPSAFRSLRSVLKILKDSPAQKKLLILDICWPLEDPYWGRLDVGVAARIPEELAAFPDPQRLVLCPCGPGQTSLAAPELNRTLFGYFLEEGLRGWADFDQANPERQGLVTVRKLAEYVQTRVEHYARLHANVRQTPILHGELPDFPLIALAKGKPIAHVERSTAEPYPPWLVDAWKARDLWLTQERHRAAPWLFRQLEAAVVHADRSWQYGADPTFVQKILHAELDRLGKYYQRITSAIRPETLSIAQHFQAGPPLDPKWIAEVKELFKRVAEARGSAAKVEEGEKSASKVIDAFAERSKQVPDVDWAGALVEVLTTDPFPRRDTLLLGKRLLMQRPGAAKYAEVDAILRIARLAETMEESAWPVALVRNALQLTYKAEQAVTRSRSYPWFASALEAAAQKRHEAEVLLAARGYVSLKAVEPILVEALREFETLTAKQDILEDALRTMHSADAFLPGYDDYLDLVPATDPTWHEAVRAAESLQGMLNPPAAPLAATSLNSLLEDARAKTDSLHAALSQLRQQHAPDVVDELLTRAGRPNADAKTLRELQAQWALPFHAPELRAKIWAARVKLATRLADKILDDETAPRILPPIQEADVSQDMHSARIRAFRRSARSLALLRLAGLNTNQLDELEKQREAFVTVKTSALDKTPPSTRDGHALAFAIRQAWAQALPQQTSAETNPLLYERVSRIAPGWMRLGAKEEMLARAAVATQQQSEHALEAWLADRYRYASQEPDAAPFVTRAAFALRGFAPKQAVGLSLPARATVAELTAQKPSQLLRIPMRRSATVKEAPEATLVLLDPNEDWLQINPLPLGAAEVAMQVALKPLAELSASPRPSGFLFGVKSGGRTYHHKVDLPLLPSAGRVEIIVSADPKEVGVPLGDLRLRPSKERQAFYAYVNNLGDKPRNLMVELRANDQIPPGGTVLLTVPAKTTLRVPFGAGGPPVKDAPPPSKEVPTPAPPSKELPELIGPVQIRVLDKERPQDVLATRDLRVDLAMPREYVRVPTIRFEPPSDANKRKNRLDVTIQTARKLTGPPCQVELVVPIERIEGLKAVRTGTFRGELPLDGTPLKLSAAELEFDAFSNDTGVVSLTVDSIERAFLFRTTFAPVGEATTPREELRPALRLSAGRYYRTNTKFEAIIETDNAPANAQLLVSLGQVRNNAFEPEIRRPKLTPRQKRIGFGLRPGDGGVEFDTLLRDWRVPFDAVPVRGERIVEARLLDGQDRDIVPPAYQRVLFDDHYPERVEFVNLPKQAKRDLAYRLKATGIDLGAGLKEVAFFLGKPTEDGKQPVGAVKFDAKPSTVEGDVWEAIVYWPADRKGFIDITAQFTNKLGLSTFARGMVELVDHDPEKNATGTIEGVVHEGPRAQTGVAVALYDAKGKKVAEQKSREGGGFAFPNLPPGPYVVVATKPTSGTPLTAKSKIELAPGKTVRLKLELFL